VHDFMNPVPENSVVENSIPFLPRRAADQFLVSVEGWMPGPANRLQTIWNKLMKLQNMFHGQQAPSHAEKVDRMQRCRLLLAYNRASCVAAGVSTGVGR
jgi:hypothetical protein